MPTRQPDLKDTTVPRPLTRHELARRLDDLLDAVAHVSRSTGGPGPRWLPTADLVRCLEPLASSN
jgi:hypothetical protein